MSEIEGDKNEYIRGHATGSRRFGRLTENSDWDFIFEDTPKTRRFLVASGYKLCNQYTDGERGATTAFMRHTHYSCEIFLVKSERERLWASRLMLIFRLMRVYTIKRYRMRLWWELEKACKAVDDCFRLAFAHRREYETERARRIAEPFRLRNKPLE